MRLRKDEAGELIELDSTTGDDEGGESWDCDHWELEMSVLHLLIFHDFEAQRVEEWRRAERVEETTHVDVVLGAVCDDDPHVAKKWTKDTVENDVVDGGEILLIVQSDSDLREVLRTVVRYGL